MNYLKVHKNALYIGLKKFKNRKRNMEQGGKVERWKGGKVEGERKKGKKRKKIIIYIKKLNLLILNYNIILYLLNQVFS